MFIKFSSISYPITKAFLENNVRMGFPISPRPATISFSSNDEQTRKA